MLQEQPQSEVQLSDTSFFNGMNKYLVWGEIYRVFWNEKYSWEDEDYETLVNIQKSQIYQEATRPTIMPYDEMSRWEFTHVNIQREVVLNEA